MGEKWFGVDGRIEVRKIMEVVISTIVGAILYWDCDGRYKAFIRYKKREKSPCFYCDNRGDNFFRVVCCLLRWADL